MPGPHFIALVLWAIAACLPVAAQSLPETRAVTTGPLVYRGPVWPAGTVVAPPLVFNGAAAPARQLAPLQPQAPLPGTPSLLKPPPRSP